MRLEVTNVSKEYPTPAGPLAVLTDVNLSLGSGDAAAIMGPSGTGKSTLLYILGALEPPTQGTVMLGDKNIFSMNPGELARFRGSEIGFVFQDHCLLPQCSVLENVLLPTLVLPSDKHVARARELINAVGLSHRAEHRPGQLSGGEKQRVAIARALIRNPRLVVCDEPTGNLDEKTAASVASVLLQLHRQQNNILLVVTHSSRLATEFPLRFEISGGRLSRVST
ncbi:MAG TPA: ABC transporter ATP-binding protein [Terriglobia bacterium]|nr:ABC transporter ATP-binding protein [Terriglobia bacterium]